MEGKIDFTKTLASYRARRGVFDIVDLPDMQYLMIDGCGDPNSSPTYAASLRALYPMAYKVKFASKLDLGRDYVVPPLEALWWSDDMSSFTSRRDKSQWKWTLMLMLPDWIDHTIFDAAFAAVARRDAPTRLGDVRRESLSEGCCVQTLHVGSFDDEAPVLAAMHEEVIPAHGLHLTGTHHEIYLSDIRRVDSAKLRTILRQPVARTSEAVSRPASVEQ